MQRKPLNTNQHTQVTEEELIEYAGFSEKMKAMAEEEMAGGTGEAPAGSMKNFSFSNNPKK